MRTYHTHQCPCHYRSPARAERNPPWNIDYGCKVRHVLVPRGLRICTVWSRYYTKCISRRMYIDTRVRSRFQTPGTYSWQLEPAAASFKHCVPQLVKLLELLSTVPLLCKWEWLMLFGRCEVPVTDIAVSRCRITQDLQRCAGGRQSEGLGCLDRLETLI